MPPFRKHLKGPANKSGNRGPRRKAFHSNRLADPEPQTEDVEIDQELEAANEEDSNDEESDVSSAEDEIPAVTINPYNALLQSLNANASTNRHRRKRRRMDVDNESNQIIANGDFPGHDNGQVQDEPVLDEEEIDADALSDLDSDVDASAEDAFKRHVDCDGLQINEAIKKIKAKAIGLSKTVFYPGWKAVVTEPKGSNITQANLSSNFRTSFAAISIKDKLRQGAEKRFPTGLSGLSAAMAVPIFDLQDVLFCGRTPSNGLTMQQLICIHTLDYVLKTRDRVLKNTAKLSKNGDDGLECRDQGFTRPKVLFLLPTREACYRIVDSIVSLYEPEQQENRKRFNDSFSRKDDDISGDKPDDFRDLFGGNDDDLFRIGIKLTRKTVKLFSQFYASDIIFASPLGLRMAMSKKDSKKEDFDFLSSIEVLVIDQADALLQQNWEHVEHVMNHLNLQPKEDHGCDFSRIRNWYLDGNAKYLRQTIVLSSFLTPELNQLSAQHMLNLEGSLKITPESFDGAIVNLGTSIKQTFQRFDAIAPQKEPDSRFKAFSTSVLPNLVKITKSGIRTSHGILIFIPSYMDFVRVRNFMANSTIAQDISFGTISEYTTSSDVARARSHFASGRHSVLLYSGRAHHFKRYKLKGIKRIVLYSLPDNPTFYTEVVGGYLGRSITEGLIAPEDANVRSLFCKWDVLKLERTVGSKRVAPMLKDQGGEVFDFA